MIRRIQYEDMKKCIEIIHVSFATVAKDFSLTNENCPGHTSFMPIEKLYNQYEEGRLMFVYEKDKKLIGYFSISKQSENSYELDNLAVLPLNYL